MLAVAKVSSRVAQFRYCFEARLAYIGLRTGGTQNVVVQQVRSTVDRDAQR